MVKAKPLPNAESADTAFEEQYADEQLVEIDEHGNVFRPGEAPASEVRPTILRDPRGEF